VGLIEEVFEEAKIRNILRVAKDEEEAILFLQVKRSFRALRAQI
jgi:hypothetical protein